MKWAFYKDYSLMLILLFFSGNPLMPYLFGPFSTVIVLMLTIIILNDKINKLKPFFSNFGKIAGVLILLFVLQLVILGFVSWPGVLNFIIKIFTGGLILYYLKDRVNGIFFKVIYHVCIISLFFFVTINLFSVSIPKLDINEYVKSYFIYTTAFHPLKNMGMFWEPGAFAGIITLCLALNFSNLEYYWHRHKLKLIVVILTLLTTQSSTGYLVGFVILVFYFLRAKNKPALFFLLPIVLSVGLYVYSSTEFLKDKIEGQYKRANEQNVGEFSNTRFGSLVFDWHYIKKHPLIGNGIHEKTRYADHPNFSTGKEGVGSGNGFSNYLASMGVFFVLGYFILIYKTFSKTGKLYGMLILIVVFLNLQGEQWFNFPIYLGLPFAYFQSNRLLALKAFFAKKNVIQ